MEAREGGHPEGDERMRVGLVFLLVLLLLLPRLVAAAPQLLSDEELDEVTAQGVDFQLNVTPDAQTLNFSFDLGSTFGNGSASPVTVPTSSSLFVNGNPSLSIFHVDNLVLNLNICVSCNAQTITQQGFGLPITLKVQP